MYLKILIMSRSNCLLEDDNLCIAEKFELFFTNSSRKWVCLIMWLLSDEYFEVRLTNEVVNYSRSSDKWSKESKTSNVMMKDEWRSEKERRKKNDELKFSKHRSLHVFDWTRHRTRKLKSTNLIDWQNRDSSISDRLQIIEKTLDKVIWRDFLISDDKIPDWIFFFQKLKKRKVDAIIWNTLHEKFMNQQYDE
jgi:UDP-2,3-diacylglucosamine pyrophosphatase LpxH